MGKNLSVCSYSSINSLLPSLSGGLECIVFKGSWNWVTFETTEGAELATSSGRGEVLLLLFLCMNGQCFCADCVRR